MVERTWLDRLKGTAAFGALVSMQSRGRQIRVPLEVVTLRASVCVDCELNQEIKSQVDKKTDEIMEAVISGLESDFDSRLQNCAVCTCSTKAITRLSDEALRETKGAGYSFGNHERRKGLAGHPNCWMRKIFP